MANNVEISIIAVDAASNILQKIGGQFGALGEVAVSALTAATAAMGSLIKAGGEQEDIMARFNSLVDASPLKDFKGEMEDMADVWVKSTRFQRDNILAAEGQLSLYTNIGKKVFPDALKATLNLATYMKTDAPAAAETLGRALEDISGGSLTLLGRQRLLTKEQIETAKAMDKAGDSAGAQAFVLGILNGKIGDLATDMGETFPGQMEIFNNSLEDFWQDQGVKVLDALEPLMADFNELAGYILPAVSNAFDNFIIPSLKNIVSAVSDLLTGKVSIGDFFKNIGTALQIIDWKKLSDDLVAGMQKIDWSSVGTHLNEGLTKLTYIIGNFLKGVDWGSVLGETLSAIGDTITGFIKPGATFHNDVVVPWQHALDEIGKYFTTMWKNAVAAVQGFFNSLIFPTMQYPGIPGASGGTGTGTGGTGFGTCFVGDTLILMGDGSTRRISDIHIGDVVQILDITGNILDQAPISAVILHPASEYQGHLIINETLEVTPNHLVFANGGWKEAGNIILGDELTTPDGFEYVLSISGVNNPQPLYDLHIDHESHNYFAEGILVHNKAEGGYVTAGIPYIVGEKGAEVFVPNTSGTIVPNNALSGQGGVTIGTVIINWSGTNAGSVRAFMSELGAAM